MGVTDNWCHQCSLCINSYADMHSSSLTNGIFALESSRCKDSVYAGVEQNGCRCRSHDQCGKGWSRFSLGLQCASNTLATAASRGHVNFQVEIDVRGRGNALQHTLPDNVPHRSKRHELLICLLHSPCFPYS